jgi:TetR/AcrR family transcriptional repressor of nem operon
MAGVRQFDEEAMLEQALELFWQKGFANTTMQDLAAATGVQRGSLYNAYGDKDTFFLKVFERYRLHFFDQMREALARPKLRDALRSYFDFVISSMTTGTPTRGCFSTKTALGTEVLEPPLQAALRQLLDDIEACLVERLSRAGDNEGLAVPVRQAARLIVTFTRGLVVIERVYADEKRMRASADALVKLLLPTSAPAR